MLLRTRRSLALVLLVAPALGGSSPLQAGKLDTAKIEEITKLKGAWNEQEGVFKVTAPRTDVKVAVDGWQMPPFMGLTSWAAFQAGKTAPAMVMGDLVLFQDEVNPVMSALLDAGLSVTALHNHFFFDEPKVCFMHLGGEGKTEELAAGVRKALDKVAEIRAAAPEPKKSARAAALPPANTIDGKTIESVLGVKGQAKDGMYKVVLGRPAQSACGCAVGKEMGVNTWAAFAGSAALAVVDGDFVTFDGELQPVLKALRRANVEIVAIHSHMEGETPKAIFVHYWGVGPVEELARAVKAALDTQKK
ncbi:MAG TPA: DUF1259 domain-containing protein [Planctomycetota bacterium]|nr:DUF1259 domain-containing protein [Planctomycetota bacterium]